MLGLVMINRKPVRDKCFIADLGNGKCVVKSLATGEFTQMGTDEFLEWSANLPSGSVLFGENPHFGCCQNDKSLAQHYPPEQLLEWYAKLEERGVTLILTPQRLTEYYRRILNLPKVPGIQGEKNDINSIEHGIFDALKKISVRECKKPQSTFEQDKRLIDADIMRDGMTEDKNWMRKFHYKHEDDKCSQWVRNNIVEIREDVAEEHRAKVELVFAMSDEDLFTKTGKLRVIPEKAVKQGTAVALTLMDSDANPRFRHNGQLAGWDFTKRHLLSMHPFRVKRAGTVRSDLYHHGRKHFISKMQDNKTLKDGNKKKSVKQTKEFLLEEWESFKYFGKMHTQAVKALRQAMKRVYQRQLLALQYQDSPVHSEESEFSNSSSTAEQLQLEATHRQGLEFEKALKSEIKSEV